MEPTSSAIGLIVIVALYITIGVADIAHFGDKDAWQLELAFIAKLRKRQFFSLAELNAAIAVEVAALNARVTRHRGASRRALLEELERSALKALLWKRRKLIRRCQNRGVTLPAGLARRMS